jgi:hypothetical protein
VSLDFAGDGGEHGSCVATLALEKGAEDDRWQPEFLSCLLGVQARVGDGGGMLAKRIATSGAELIGFGISDAVGNQPTGDIGVPYDKYASTPIGPDKTTLDDARIHPDLSNTLIV